jgi:hypothetical protein
LREEHRLKGFENRVLRRIFGPRREKDGSWRNLHNDELHKLFSPLNIVRVIKSRRMWWAGHVARMGEGQVFTGIWMGGPKVRDHWEELGVCRRIILKLDLREIGIDRANWIRQAQDRVRWRAFLNTVMNRRVP